MPDQIFPTEKEINLLLNMTEDDLKNEKPPEPSAAKNSLSALLTSPLFKGYELDEKDVKVIAILFRNLLDGRDETKSIEVLKKINREHSINFLEIKRLNRLKEIGIVAQAINRSGTGEEIGLFRSNICLADGFLKRLYTVEGKEKAEGAEIEPYKDNLEYLSDQFERIRLLKEIKNIREAERRKAGGQPSFMKLKEEELKKTEAGIAERMNRADEIFPFEEFRKNKKLNQKEELIVLALLGNEIIEREDGIFIDDLLDIISRTPYEILQDRRLLQKDGRLFRKKIIEASRIANIFTGSKMEFIRLNEDLKIRFLGEKKRQRREQFKGDSFFEIIKPTVPLEKVVLHPKAGEELSMAIEKIEGNAANLLQEWGITNNLLRTGTKKRGKAKQPVAMLFYGPPGTGKTLAANAAAYKLKGELITVDCSKILGCYVGESEKNTRKIFDKYRAMAKGKRNPPVLFLNEADQFLHRRINASRSTDHMYNQMQNIFLEQLERFEGILIATTNLIENLDSAFSRRFHHKIEFRRPGNEERLKLWQIHIPEKAPLSDDVNLRYLADNYDLSGGQIAVVIQNAAARAVRRRDGAISMADFIMACNEEIRGNFDERAKNKVGF